MEEKLKNAHIAINKFKVAVHETMRLRLRGETGANKERQSDYWKKKCQEERDHRELLEKDLMTKLTQAETELARLREDRRFINESIINHNTRLLGKLKGEMQEKLTLLDEVANDHSLLNNLEKSRRTALLQEMKAYTKKDIKKIDYYSSPRRPLDSQPALFV